MKFESKSLNPQNSLLEKNPSISNDKSENQKESSRALSHKQSRKTIRAPLKIFGLPQTLESRGSSSRPLIMREDESPWDTFQQVFHCKLAGTVIMCIHRTHPYHVEAIREYPAAIANKALQLFQQIQHKNIISARECYRDGDRLYAWVDDFPLTLEHLASLLISERELSSIVSQVGYFCSRVAGSN